MRRLLTVAATSLCLLVGCLAGSAQAVPAQPPAAGSGCLAGSTGQPRDGAARTGDPSALSAAKVRRLEQQTRRLTAQLPESAARVDGDGGVQVVDVAVHVVQDRVGNVEVPRRRARALIRVLNGGFAGAQSTQAFDTSFRFRLTSYDRTVNPRWYVADVSSWSQRPVVARMKRALHVGGPETLNLYLSRPRELLGWATLPQHYRAAPRMDGVVVSIGSLPGGDLRHYNLGDTTVHEVGHWLGLYHTFQGGCSRLNDRVGDTAPEAAPNYECPVGRDTCTDDESLDPIHNFMDYSYDRCMSQFTGGQDERMLVHWLAYRQ